MEPKSRKEKEVWQACEQLAEENTAITYQAVGDRLVELGYRRGSNSDIHRYLTTWKQKQRGDTFSIEASPLSLNSGDPLHQALDAYKQKIWATANHKINALQADLANKTSHILELERENLKLKQRPEKNNEAAPEIKAALETLSTAVQSMAHARDEELIKLYAHHQAQFDRYLKAISSLKTRCAKLSSQVRHLKLEYESALSQQRAAFEAKLRTAQKRRRTHAD